MSDSTQSDKGDDSPPQVFPWVRATLDDLSDFDFEAPIVDSHSADSQELGDLYRRASNPEQNNEVPDTPVGRVFAMLWAVTNMHFRPKQPNDPFGAMLVLPDGGRSALPADFRGAPIEVLSQMAERAKHPVLRARLADVCWLLDRKRSTLAVVAIDAYVAIVKEVDAGRRKFRFDDEPDALTYEATDLLRRALQIGQAIGPDKPGSLAARELVAALRARAFEKRLPHPVHWFTHLDLDYGISDPASIGKEVEILIPILAPDIDPHSILELWRLAARAYHLAKRDDDKWRARLGAAEQLASMGQGQPSAMLGAQFLAEAIAELHGVPGQRERRRELNHRLIDVQADIFDEMSTFSIPLDVKDIVQQIQQGMRGHSLRDQLFVFAGLARSPEPSELVDQAKKKIAEYPLSSMFGVSHHDREGKVVHRSGGANFGDSEDSSAVAREIAEDERHRRQISVAGWIEPARQSISTDHNLTDDLFAHVLAHSPFVPPDLLMTFCRGFVRFFQGDFVSGLYILTPLLENSLRYVLKNHGDDVSKFDDANLTQQDRTISILFEQMRGELDSIFGKAHTTDIENVFLKKPGPHLRHALSHGLLHDGDPYGPEAIYACWLIFHLCMVPLVPYRTQIHLPYDDASQSAPQTPPPDTSGNAKPATQ